jgi:hypothetical protein
VRHNAGNVKRTSENPDVYTENGLNAGWIVAQQRVFGER